MPRVVTLDNGKSYIVNENPGWNYSATLVIVHEMHDALKKNFTRKTLESSYYKALGKLQTMYVNMRREREGKKPVRKIVPWMYQL
jgi:hypothetical protein